MTFCSTKTGEFLDQANICQVIKHIQLLLFGWNNKKATNLNCYYLRIKQRWPKLKNFPTAYVEEHQYTENYKPKHDTLKQINITET